MISFLNSNEKRLNTNNLIFSCFSCILKIKSEPKTWCEIEMNLAANNEQSIFVSHRSANQGSFLIFPDDPKSYSPDLPHIKKVLNAQKKPHAETLTAILTHGISALDSQNCIGYKELLDDIPVSLRTVRSHLSELRALNIIVPVPFEFADGTFHPKVKAETINLSLDSLTPVVIEEIGPEDLKPQTTSLVEKRWQRKKALVQHDVEPMDKRIDSKKLPHVVRPRGEFIVDQLVSHKPRPRGPLARKKSEELQQYDEQSRTFTINTPAGPKNFLAQIRSYTSVMDAKDLQVQFAVYSMIYNYHSYFSSRNGTVPRNLTPVYVDDIVLMIGRKLGGKNRDYVRDCIQVIEDNEFNLLSLEEMNIQLDDTLIRGFAHEKYKNFKSCTPISLSPPTRDPETGRVKLASDAMVYLIALPDLIFENLVQNETVFAFPPESLSMRVLMFALYLRFRALVRDHPFSEGLKNLKNKLQYDDTIKKPKGSKLDTYQEFLKDLHSEFSYIAKNQQPHLWAKIEENSIRFNIFGYHGEVDFKKQKYFVSCHLDEMLRCCKVVNQNAKAIVESAPVIYNGMSALFPERIHKRLNIAINKIITSESLMFNMKYSTDSKFGEVLVHKYASSDEIKKAAKELAFMSEASFDVDVLYQKIERDLDGLVGLKLGRHLVTKDDWNRLIADDYLMMYANDLDPIDLLQRINRTRSIHRDLLDFFNGTPISAKLTKFLDRYLEQVMPEEDY